MEVNEKEVDGEIRKTTSKRKIPERGSVSCAAVHHVLSCVESLTSTKEVPWYMSRLSRYTQIVRRMAWIQRFVGNCRNRRRICISGPLSLEEVRKAELTLFKLVQEESFAGVGDPRLVGMTIFMDSDGLIRLKSLISNRSDELGFRLPIVLDYRHPLVQKLIYLQHLVLNHGPIDYIMNKLREEYRVLCCRRAVQSIVRRCIVCKRHTVKRLEAVPAPLPEARVRDAVAFEVIGVDLAGPLYLRNGDKGWVVLFTCAVFRAVHLELVTSLSTDAFLESLRRFIARKGRPAIIYCDNGTNFVGAHNLLRGLDWAKVVARGVLERIEWRFNPPSAPWWGGWWERLVRVTKDLLKRTLKKTSLTYEELQTTLCDCEAVINSRPLTYLAEDPEQLIPLSPDMFLRDLRLHGVADLDQVDAQALTRRLRYRQRLKDELRERFRVEYLGQLARRSFEKGLNGSLKEGDLVFVGSDNTKRLDWPLARVIEVFPGKDGVVRVVRVKTAIQTLTRPIQRLFPLELSSSEASELTGETSTSGCEPEQLSTVENTPMTAPWKTVTRKHTIKKNIPRANVGLEREKPSSPIVTRGGRVVRAPRKLQD
ncbi:uncharacterized protein LOC107042035 [Diachasma alloeum]|uniref:uncharacterized protein LOC107042035 n=1 Tax=Diachasma alloeum TaxID=454923 RepID=UPI0007383895|nr:uncharacterized protein LOC107042035 [Diachasma alloeum]